MSSLVHLDPPRSRDPVSCEPPEARSSAWTLLGVGAVGRALLRRLASEPPSSTTATPKLVGVRDRSGFWFDRDGLDPAEVAERKEAGRPLGLESQTGQVSWPVLLGLFPFDGVIDCTSSDLSEGDAALARSRAILDSGRRIVFAAKHALLAGTAELLEYGPLVGWNAVLGGTGRRLQEELPRLRREATEFSGVVNATTTHLIEAVERGADWSTALDSARSAGLLEADPAQDLDGTDAAIKLVIVARALFDLDLDLDAIPRPRITDLDPSELRARCRRGISTRLVARASRTEVSLAYEPVSAVSSFAVSSRRVSYTYTLESGRRLVLVGDGLGPVGTAQALWRDLQSVVTDDGRSS